MEKKSNILLSTCLRIKVTARLVEFPHKIIRNSMQAMLKNGQKRS